jgi:hypothetical protein
MMSCLLHRAPAAAGPERITGTVLIGFGVRVATQQA